MVISHLRTSILSRYTGVAELSPGLYIFSGLPPVGKSGISSGL